MKIILIFTLLLLQVKAQDLTEKEIYGKPNPLNITAPIMKEQKESIYFSDEVLRDYDPESGIMSDSFFTMRDKNRFSVGYHLSTNYNDFSEINSLELEFMQNLRDWENAWWGLIFKTGSASFEAITENHDLRTGASSNSDASASKQRLLTAEQSFNIMGIGMGHRFRFLLDFINTDRLYEQVMVYLTYMTNTDSFTNLEYAGPGFTMDYQVFKRSSQRVYYGWKLSYNLASVTREIADDIRNREARLTLSWITLGFSVGYYF